ncbi:tetraacyldisaccharide 4'-kinase [Thermodesulfovibrio yellowstonii]|uniref:tetraacyldisaccharide 4'-kinase n=1 Tax=Thermodesulfovibrio yellowstonii TaxID=28262 RepID=UPI003C7D4D5F
MNIFERIYLFFYLRKKKKDLKSQKKLPFPVISVGNLTVGGTGKTPFTIALAKELKKREYKPIILTRGYRGRLKGPLVVTEEMDAQDVGDESLMMAMEGLTVIKCPDRYSGGIYAIEKLGFTDKGRAVFIVDDGFQHWKLYRNVNILLIDGFKGFGNCCLIPCGPLRSPLTEITEADMVFITKKENNTIYQRIKDTGIKEVYFAPFKVEGIIRMDGRKIEPAGHKVFAFAGIGNFQGFLSLLNDVGFKVDRYKKFIDHKKYSETTLKRILNLASEAELLVTTKKDFVKIKDFSNLLNSLCYMEISTEINSQTVDKIIDLMHNC